MTQFKVGDKVRLIRSFDGVRGTLEVVAISEEGIGVYDPDAPDTPTFYNPDVLELAEPQMTLDDLVTAASRKMCEMSNRDPDERIAIQPYPGCVVDANGAAYVPLWETVTPEVRNYLMITEAVKLALGAKR